MLEMALAGLIPLAIAGGAFVPRLRGGIADMETFMGYHSGSRFLLPTLPLLCCDCSLRYFRYPPTHARR